MFQEMTYSDPNFVITGKITLISVPYSYTCMHVSVYGHSTKETDGLRFFFTHSVKQSVVSDLCLASLLLNLLHLVLTVTSQKVMP